MGETGTSTRKVMALVLTMSLIVITALFALVYFSLKGTNGGTATASSDALVNTNSVKQGELPQVDPVQVMVTLSQGLPPSTDVTAIKREIVQIYHSNVPKLNRLASAVQYNEQLKLGLQSVMDALHTEYYDTLQHSASSRLESDAVHLHQSVQSYLLLLQTQENSL